METPRRPGVPRETGGLQDAATTGKHMTYISHSLPLPVHQSFNPHLSSFCFDISPYWPSLSAARDVFRMVRALVSCPGGLPGMRKTLGSHTPVCPSAGRHHLFEHKEAFHSQNYMENPLNVLLHAVLSPFHSLQPLEAKSCFDFISVKGSFISLLMPSLVSYVVLGGLTLLCEVP